MAEASVETDAVTRGKVTEVCRLFLTSTDEGLAQRLQNEEFDKKYEWNRATRKVARVDVPLAKNAHDEEEERLQKERFDFLQEQSKLAEEDQRVAQQLHQEEQQHTQQEANLASDDAKIALEMQKQEILGKESNRIQLELEDQALALRFQEQERELEDMRTMEREIREQRRLLELELLHEDQMGDRLGQRHQIRNLDRPTENRDTVAILAGGSEGYRLSNMEFVSDAEKQEVLKMQDEELARALQEREEQKAAHRARREIAADIEQRDYQLARIMQEVEKLELAKRQHQAGGSYGILPVPHVEASVPTASHTSSRRSNSVTTTGNVTDSSNYSHVYVPASHETGAGNPSGNSPPIYSVVRRSPSQPSSPTSNNSVAIGSTSSNGSTSSPQTSLPPTTSPPRPPPPTSSSVQGHQYANVTHTRITETHVTSHPASSSHGYSRSMNNNQAGSRNSSITGHYQEVGDQVKPTRQSSKNKSCILQ